MRRFIALICAILVAAPSLAQAPSSPPPGYGPPIAVDHALALVRRGMEQSAAKGLKMAIAVVEPSGELVAFARMDDVPYGSIRLAQQKARTSARLRMTTASMEERVMGGGSVLFPCFPRTSYVSVMSNSPKLPLLNCRAVAIACASGSRASCATRRGSGVS